MGVFRVGVCDPTTVPEDLRSIVVEEVAYSVNDKHVVLDYSSHKKKVDDIISEIYGKKV
jgi:hypothetical protein